ncbi:50S ribosomal protein L25/general stress protein Ctc [Galactobacter caseinivorans]|uniref:Large ribosomal subunit protein bL25 n=1 Tax=Galactobacter caseinivorans TaxID=2676123 RepID=A0A496PJI3_9MICC|nr:50S ribosomal protein L25/general stress protein Ctc [Galactobacter caseinivorans]RKW70663.1 50S ribosomal protein L25/general stress protein Ctc [Galactobacter caseinivorans]
MSDQQKIVAEVRNDFGKGAARQARRDGKIPAVIYGHGAQPQHVLVPGREITLAVRTSNVILDLDIAGKSTLVLVKDIQRHPLRQTVDHLDLLIVRKGEKVQVDVNVHVEGEPAPGLVVNLDMNTVLVLADALKLPEFLTVSVEGLEAGTVTAADLVLPKGVELEIESDTVIASIAEPEEQDLPEDEETEETAEAEEAPAE